MEWVKFNKESLPSWERSTLVTNGTYVVYAVLEYDGRNPFFHDGTGILKDVTHWMYFPEPPK